MAFNIFNSSGILVRDRGLIAEELRNRNSITCDSTKYSITIKSLFADYNGNYIPEEIDWGEDVGLEVIDDSDPFHQKSQMSTKSSNYVSLFLGGDYMYTAKDIANFFIDITKDDPESDLTNMKINKMLYISQVIYYGKFGKPLFSDAIEAWDHGPVVYSIYKKYKNYGNNSIHKLDEDFDEGIFDSSISEFLISIQLDYGKYSASWIRQLSHYAGGSWARTYNGKNRTIIPKDEIRKDYSYISKSISHFDFDEAVRRLPRYKTHIEDGVVVVEE